MILFFRIRLYNLSLNSIGTRIETLLRTNVKIKFQSYWSNKLLLLAISLIQSNAKVFSRQNISLCIVFLSVKYLSIAQLRCNIISYDLKQTFYTTLTPIVRRGINVNQTL